MVYIRDHYCFPLPFMEKAVMEEGLKRIKSNTKAYAINNNNRKAFLNAFGRVQEGRN
ncbi:hypothetical protein [Robertkochia solimangrovi]|uniref:hypothetical protein n=1 Tax=Robertkochia solimangrovi TaxID=2213046 RepID=UPI0013A546D2|nr:hypothetical protein [Robertkochia solimangrovi]